MSVGGSCKSQMGRSIHHLPTREGADEVGEGSRVGEEAVGLD